MSTSDFSIDSFLSDMVIGVDGFMPSDSTGSGESNSVSARESGYEGSTDFRIRQLSYSSILTLHTCPRKFQLYKLRSSFKTEEDSRSTVTFAFGHVVGEGIQKVLEGFSEEEVIWNLFLGWEPDLAASDPKLDKSFYSAVFAVQKFIQARAAGLLKDYELVSYNGKPACELSFCITFPDGFRLRGYVDAVLRHKSTGEVLVLECKTTGSATVNPAMYKNSAQAIGYSVVLDNIFPDLSSYRVLYLVYQTKGKEYITLPFVKTYLQRALWIRELLLDIEAIKMYEQAGLYPMHGENCYSFFRECEYLQTCTLGTEYLTKVCTQGEIEAEQKVDYQVNITLADLIETQLEKTS